MQNAISISTNATPAFLSVPEGGKLGGVPVPQSAVMFGVEGGKIYRFSETNDSTDRDWVDGGLEFYGIKGISRWSTESKDGKYGTLNYVRFFLTTPYKGVTYCLQLSDGSGRDGKATCPPAHIRGLVQSLVKAKRLLAPLGQSLALMPGVICPKAGDDANVTFLNLFVGADPFDTNSLVQVFCDINEGEHLEKTFDAFDAAIDELCESLGQETPESAAADAAADALADDAIEVGATSDGLPF